MAPRSTHLGPLDEWSKLLVAEFRDGCVVTLAIDARVPEDVLCAGLAHPALRSVERLDVLVTAHVDADRLAAAFASVGWPSLVALRWSARNDAAALRAMFDMCPRLAELSLRAAPPPLPGSIRELRAERLAAPFEAPELQKLILVSDVASERTASYDRVAPYEHGDAIEVLAASPAWHRLEELVVDEPGDEVARTLGRAPPPARMQRLTLTGGTIRDGGAASLAALTGWPSLMKLDVDDNNISEAGRAALAELPAMNFGSQRVHLRDEYALTPDPFEAALDPRTLIDGWIAQIARDLAKLLVAYQRRALASRAPSSPTVDSMRVWLAATAEALRRDRKLDGAVSRLLLVRIALADLGLRRTATALAGRAPDGWWGVALGNAVADLDFHANRQHEVWATGARIAVWTQVRAMPKRVARPRPDPR